MIVSEQIVRIVDSVVASIAAIAAVAAFVALLVAPQALMRLGVRLQMSSRTAAQRERMAKKSDRVAYYYLGTTGDKDRDGKIARFDAIYGRALGIATVLGALGLIAFVVLHGLLS
jgi:hypothetical protein